MDIRPLRPFKVPEDVTTWTEPAPQEVWIRGDPSLEGKTGVSVFAKSPDSIQRLDVYDTGIPILDMIRRKRAEAVAGYLAIREPSRREIGRAERIRKKFYPTQFH